MDITEMIEAASYNKTTFSDNPQPGEMTVADALYERIEAYKKAKMNG